MPRAEPSPRGRRRALLLGVAGALALAGGVSPALTRTEDDCHCPPYCAHCTEGPPEICFKSVAPKPVCVPCDQPFWGYYPTHWSPWPAPDADRPDPDSPGGGVPPPGPVPGRMLSARPADAPLPTAPGPRPGAPGELTPPQTTEAPPHAMPAAPREPGQAAEPAGSRPAREAAPGRRGYADLTVQPWFACAEDHSWLKGRVLHDAGTNTWRLHYASVDDADPYGGTMTLTGGDEKALKDGQAVRVRGRLPDPGRHERESPYQVSSFDVLKAY